MASSFFVCVEGDCVGGGTGEAKVGFMPISPLSYIRKVGYLLCLCLVQHFFLTDLFSKHYRLLDLLKNQVAHQKFMLCFFGGSAKSQVLFLRTLQVMLLEIRVLCYSPDGPS